MTTDLILLWISLISLGWLVLTTPVLLRNRFELTRLPKLRLLSPTHPDKTLVVIDPAEEPENVPAKGSAKDSAKNVKNTHNQPLNISICIPVRNEELVINTLLDSLRRQTWPFMEVLVLDDQSEDSTPSLLNAQKARFSADKIQFTILCGRPKPSGWLGKPWACKQLADHATGDVLLFLDADTEAAPDFTERIAAAIEDQALDMLTIWPQQKLGSFWEKTVIPLMYYALVTLLPAIYVSRPPRWMPPPFRNTFRTAFAAACGQCIAFRRSAYKIIGGHQAVKSNVVEDVELAKLARFHHLKVRMFEGITSLSCRMYRNEKEMFQGFRKNFLAGFNHHLILFVSAALLHLLVFIFPFFIFIYALFSQNAVLLLLSSGSAGLLFAHRLLLSSWFQWNPAFGFLHPLGVLWFQRLGLTKILDHLLQRKSAWKGRNI